MKGYATPSALAWLEAVFRERYDLPIQLRLQESTQRVCLELEGQPRSIVFATDFLAYTRADSDLPCVSWTAAKEGWACAIDGSIPAPGATELRRPLVERTEDGCDIGYDVVGLCYWMLTRQEEVDRKDLDRHGRFPARASHAFKHGYLERPIVDEWLHVLGQIIESIWPGIRLRRHTFRMLVSHDVDAPSRYGFRSWSGVLRAMAADVLKRGDMTNALRAPWVRFITKDAISRQDPDNTFDWIMDVSERHGLKSAFYFICGRTDPSRDADYEVEHPAIRALMRRIHSRGHEIGLHPSYGSYLKPDVIKSEAERLRRVACEECIEQSEWGGRMHYLRWAQPFTMRAWADAGMDYESTLSYADRPGFRCGTCFEFPAFDPVAQARLPLRIRPLIAMECTVMADRYMGLGNGQEALSMFADLKDKCRSVGGVFTTLWHNTYFSEKRPSELYEALLAK